MYSFKMNLRTLLKDSQHCSHWFYNTAVCKRLCMFAHVWVCMFNVLLCLSMLCFYSEPAKGLQMRISFKLNLVQFIKWQHLCLILYMVPLQINKINLAVVNWEVTWQLRRWHGWTVSFSQVTLFLLIWQSKRLWQEKGRRYVLNDK